MIDLGSLDGFEWDDGNRTKNWDKHQVSSSECEEIFFNIPLLLYTDTAHSQQEPRFYVLGKTSTDRRLFLSFTVRGTKIRVISARPMSRRERKIVKAHLFRKLESIAFVDASSLERSIGAEFDKLARNGMSKAKVLGVDAGRNVFSGCCNCSL